MPKLSAKKDFRAWLRKAASDLRAAKILIKEMEFEPSAYHSQQSVEKALKAFLVFKNQDVTKTHNLVFLNDLCLNIDSEFQSIMEFAKSINPFSTVFRYPDDLTEPDPYDVEQACIMADKIYKFVTEKIIDLERSQTRIPS